jgi:AcrR family transcriptional regulator
VSKSTYRSTLRQQQARETRARIRRAARELFGEEGFAATTMTSIADRAGVAPATVYVTFGSKGGIVSSMLDEMGEQSDLGPRLQTMFAEADPPAQLRHFVEAHCVLFAGGVDVLRAALMAKGAPEVRALVERGDGSRRRVIEKLVRRWSELGALRQSLDPAEAAERMWLLTTTEAFLTATDRLRWTPDRYQSWLTGLLERELLEAE